MRQRPIDINQTCVFVDTQPRPVNRSGLPRRIYKTQGGCQAGGGGDVITEGHAWCLLSTAVVLLLGGAYLVRGNQYAHLHRQIQKSYYTYLQDWDGGVGAAFAATSWELHAQGLKQPLPLKRRTWASKRLQVPLAPGAASDSGGAEIVRGTSASIVKEHNVSAEPSAGGSPPGESQEGQQAQQQRRGRRKAAQSSLLEFRLEGLLETLHQSHVPAMDRHKAEHNRLWRPVGPELWRPVAMSLQGTDQRTGVVSVVELGPVVFMRERTVPTGGEGRCLQEEHGVWQQDATCSVQEYLWGLCVKVSQDSVTGAFAADNITGGGPGCGPEWGWEIGQWRRLDERRQNINGRAYLPISARNSTILTVRHARDPTILESDLVRRLAPNVEEQILFHAVGLALCFLGLVLLFSVGAFAAPALLRGARLRWAALLDRQHQGGAGTATVVKHRRSRMTRRCEGPTREWGVHGEVDGGSLWKVDGRGTDV
ncbi:hypothetical protein VaNZ11_006992 [Volvox africanus]|uniref:Uncharacterized protein n=1 Tax=Volvox africanus TaxID=51714 RepID=A0ABQ5S290_9CHLO|nr:hypothetical protein VaNZ11_006992 [Volvox africanus]